MCKSIHFDDSQDIYKAIRKVKYQKNNLNRLSIYITERLPEREEVIKKAANGMDLITTTHNCLVSALQN